MTHKIIAITMMMTADALHWVSLHARRGVTVLTITSGSSPVIIPVLQSRKRRVGEVPSRSHMRRGNCSRKGGVTFHLSPWYVPITMGMLFQLLNFEQNNAAKDDSLTWNKPQLMLVLYMCGAHQTELVSEKRTLKKFNLGVWSHNDKF